MAPESVATDAVVDALAHRHRRTVLRTVAQNEQGTTSVATLTDAVADVESSDRLSDAEPRQRILIALHHRHLPKMDEAGLIRYDTGTGRVRGALDGLEQDLLESIDAHERHESASSLP